MTKRWHITLLALLLVVSCTTKQSLSLEDLLIDKAQYDTIYCGRQIELFTLTNDQMAVQITNYGSRIVSIILPDRESTPRNVCWSEPSIKEMLQSPMRYSGTIIGRHANRLSGGGKVLIDGREYQLSLNDAGVHEHGGKDNISFRVWEGSLNKNEQGEDQLTLTIISEDGDQGYPGNLTIKAVYTLKACNTLELQLSAVTDAPTLINLTSHPFFNLSGDMYHPTDDHLLTIPAEYYTPIESDKIVTGEIRSVEATPYDFRTTESLVSRVEEHEEQLDLCGGYDLTYIISREVDHPKVMEVAHLSNKLTGIELTVSSNQPTIQLYGGPAQRPSQRVSTEIQQRYGVAIEPQWYLNSPNCEEFPTPILYPGEEYLNVICYSFDWAM